MNPPPGIVRRERAEYPLKSGVAAVEMPSEFSPEDYEDFEARLQLILRTAKRSIRRPRPNKARAQS